MQIGGLRNSNVRIMSNRKGGWRARKENERKKGEREIDRERERERERETEKNNSAARSLASCWRREVGADRSSCRNPT